LVYAKADHQFAVGLRRDRLEYARASLTNARPLHHVRIVALVIERVADVHADALNSAQPPGRVFRNVSEGRMVALNFPWNRDCIAKDLCINQAVPLPDIAASLRMDRSLQAGLRDSAAHGGP